MSDFGFKLAFGFTATAAGICSFTAPIDTTVLQIDTNLAILASFDPTASYPVTSTSGLLFVCSQAGRFDAAIALKAGQAIYFCAATPAAFKVCLGYVLPDIIPAP